MPLPSELKIVGALAAVVIIIRAAILALDAIAESVERRSLYR